MVIPAEKVPISAKFDGSRTAHLQPLIDFLKAQGNAPASEDFTFDRDGYGSYYFVQALDMEALRARFDLPASIVAGQSGVYDTRNFVGIGQHVAQGPPIKLNF